MVGEKYLKENNEILFLAYLNRSGSTLLAKKLNNFKDIAVSLEANFSRNIVDCFYAVDNREIDYWLNIIYMDYKFNSWNLDKDVIKKELLQKKKPIQFNDFLKVALGLLLIKEKNNAKLIIFKSHMLFWGNLIQTIRLFPGSKHIFIDRDPRAIYNSQKKSIDSRTKKPMLTDRIEFALGYKRNHFKIKHYKNQVRLKEIIHVLKYEDLILNECDTLNQIIGFLEVSNEKLDNQDYYEKIPEEQKHLHQNLTYKNKVERINAWRNELNIDDTMFLGFVLKHEIKSNGYNTFYKKVNIGIANLNLIKDITIFWLRFYPKHFIKCFLVTLGMRKHY